MEIPKLKKKADSVREKTPEYYMEKDKTQPKTASKKNKNSKQKKLPTIEELSKFFMKTGKRTNLAALIRKMRDEE